MRQNGSKQSVQNAPPIDTVLQTGYKLQEHIALAQNSSVELCEIDLIYYLLFIISCVKKRAPRYGSIALIPINKGTSRRLSEMIKALFHQFDRVH